MVPYDTREEVAAWQARHGADRFTAVEQLRAAHEQAARENLPPGAIVVAARTAVERGLAPELAGLAAAHLGAAESHQWEIGTWATGSGEGLASMGEVRRLQLARAWLLSSVASPPRDEILRLLKEVEEDANQIAERELPHAAALRRRIS